MRKEKVAFVVTRYGKDMNGGVEQHCRMLAERLTEEYDVEVLTTCVSDYVKGGNELLEGDSWIGNILVRRFKVDPVNPEKHRSYLKQAKVARRIRKHLYQMGILKVISNLFPVWTFKEDIEQKMMKSHLFYSSQLISHIQTNKNDYKAIISLNVSYPPIIYSVLSVPEKSILIPTMHYEGSSFRSIYTKVFTCASYIGFNTMAEQRLAEDIFGKKISPHGIISVGVEIPEAADWEKTKKKYNLPDEYLLYVGRVDMGKLNHIVKYFTSYKQRHKESNLKFVFVGGLVFQPNKQENIIYTGFVDDHEKIAIINHAKIVVNPSKFESLSLILLEAMSLGKAMLVNGHCKVLKEHCEKSGNAALYYKSETEFLSRLRVLDTSDSLRQTMGEKGKKYVAENYNWETIMNRLKQAIRSL